MSHVVAVLGIQASTHPDSLARYLTPVAACGACIATPAIGSLGGRSQLWARSMRAVSRLSGRLAKGQKFRENLGSADVNSRQRKAVSYSETAQAPGLKGEENGKWFARADGARREIASLLIARLSRRGGPDGSGPTEPGIIQELKRLNAHPPRRGAPALSFRSNRAP